MQHRAACDGEGEPRDIMKGVAKLRFAAPLRMGLDVAARPNAGYSAGARRYPARGRFPLNTYPSFPSPRAAPPRVQRDRAARRSRPDAVDAATASRARNPDTAS
ncbi:hypothetical protein X977_5764 [Burkholderia pseudomallei MSHR7504]|nr:hypothetical protein X977_5764 [Burkholderia pseudomallei MSHR7504]